MNQLIIYFLHVLYMNDYMIITFQDFHDKFYLRNAPLLKQIYDNSFKPENDHSLLESAIEQYITHSINELQIPLRKFIKQFIYVKYVDFLKSLEITIKKANKQLSENEEYFIYSCNDLPSVCIEKSNFFLLLLFFDILHNHPEFTKLINNIKYIFIGTNNDLNEHFKKSNENLSIIYLDDCSYSGSQLGHHIDETMWHNNNYLIIPYISKNAYIYLINLNSNLTIIFDTKIDNLVIPEELKGIYIIKENDPKIMNLLKYCHLQNYQSSWYFQHKFADDRSIPNGFLNYAPVFNEIFINRNRDITPNNLYESLEKYIIDKISEINIQSIKRNPLTIDPFVFNLYMLYYKNTNNPDNIKHISLINNCPLSIKTDKMHDNLFTIKTCDYVFYKNLPYVIPIEGGNVDYYKKYMKYKHKYRKYKQNN